MKQIKIPIFVNIISNPEYFLYYDKYLYRTLKRREINEKSPCESVDNPIYYGKYVFEHLPFRFTERKGFELIQTKELLVLDNIISHWNKNK